MQILEKILLEQCNETLWTSKEPHRYKNICESNKCVIAILQIVGNELKLMRIS